MNITYAKDGSQEFNQRLHDSLTRIADQVEADMGANLVSLILGGGYGRGEGGVVKKNGMEMPYNDLDFALVVSKKSSIPWDKLNSIRASFARELGIHVDFSRPLTLKDIEHWPCWLMWYDLLNGHVVLKGPPDLLKKHAPATLRKPLPVIEATRLLLNRGAGILWSLRVVRNVEAEPDEDFVRRNYYKCALALGDSLLITYQKYTTQYSGRDLLLKELVLDKAEVASLNMINLYDEALAFKFRPDSVSSAAISETELSNLAQLWGKIFLLVETVRTGMKWSTLDEYVNWDGIRESDQHSFKSLVGNVVRNLYLRRLSMNYPREDLYRQLPQLLGLTTGPSVDWAIESERFLKIWDRFN